MITLILERGKKHGKGIEYDKFTGKKNYEGEWKDDKKNGNINYNGKWKDGKKHGKGIEYDMNKNEYYGEWEDGKKV